jgi:hypothetical protein
MSPRIMDRKTFLGTIGTLGGAACMCAAASGMRSALGAEPTPSPAPAPSSPGDTTVTRAAKRMEFVDEWLPRFFRVMDETVEEAARRKLMEANGKACFVAYAGPPRKTPRPDELERLKAWIASSGADKGYSLQGDAILFEYLGSAETGHASPERVCLCPTAEAQKSGKLSPTFCHCSVGYVREMHERMLGRTVKVELLDSVLAGGARCRFKITVA